MQISEYNSKTPLDTILMLEKLQWLLKQHIQLKPTLFSFTKVSSFSHKNIFYEI